MKALPCFLVCFNRWGYFCLRKEFSSKRKALKTARELINDGFAFSYQIKVKK